ncbi:formin-like protein 5 [Neltuma alba]|uniref:formin-like protein 5 n=1 Tax=Neltuma alba TaxID=207710 RepID=UPI0010A33A1E|nr:formin-like protein 5 [Prosopis alba]
MPHRRSSSSSPFLSPPLLIIILPIIILLFLFLALPPFLSFTSSLLRPTSVRKSWDSINILFVLFAILCGVFAKRNDEDSASSEEVETVRVRAVGYEKTVEQEDGPVSRHWYGFPENKIYDSPPIIRLQSPMAGVSRLRRSSSSYPDLRQESLWETESDRHRYRFFDDFEIDRFRLPEREQIPVGIRMRPENVEEKVGEEADVKEIQVDTFEIRSSSPQPPQPAPKSPTPPPTPPPPPPPHPPATARPKSRRTYQRVPRKKKVEHVKVDDNDITRNPSPPRPPPPPPPPPAPSFQTEWEHKRGRNQRRKSNVKREIAMVWASLSNQKKRKRKQRTTKVDHIHSEDNLSAKQPPPPPPPPPPPSVFHSWFKKGGGKNKKIHSVSKPPPPAPPPPPPLTSSKRWSFRKPKIPPPPPPPPPPAAEPLRRRNSGRPPLPTRTSTFHNETLLNSGNQSPLIPIPPPPPPPFKIPEMKFTVRGDFVRIRSTNSSRCGSPEPEEDPDDPKPKDDPPEMEIGGTTSCPSPDVNVKASTFIARLRGEWKLEKINSMKEKQNLGLYGPGPMRGPS